MVSFDGIFLCYPAVRIVGVFYHTGRWKPGEGIGRQSDRGLKTSAGRTTGDQTLLEGDGQLNRHGRRGGKGRKKRGYGKTTQGKEPG